MAASKKVLAPVTPFITWDVGGSFVIPGTREKVSFGPVRVSAPTKQKASADLANMLSQEFSKELRQRPRVAFEKAAFSAGFAMMNLAWKVVPGKVQGPPAVTAPIQVDDRNDPPAIVIPPISAKAAIDFLTKQAEESTETI